ncbi:probable serine/threonine-protein kinase kinX isoform X2 [Solea solea]|nr:probable serine/threonine-protein kinase kinX isoform X2 [Solea solea]
MTHCTNLHRESKSTMYKMYNAQLDEGSNDDDDKNSLFSSFWSDGEKHEEEEEEEIIERMVIEDEAKFVAEAGASLLEASEDDKPKLKDQGNFTEEGSKDGSNVVEEEEKTERVVNEEDSVFVAEDEDSSEEEQESNGEEEIEQVVNDEDSNLVSEEEHSLQEDSEKEDGSKGERPELDGEGNSSSESYNHQSVDEEAEKMEHVVVETEEYLQEDSEDEKPEVNNKENLTSGSSEERSDDDYDGDDDDEEEENEPVFSEEDLFEPVVEADDPLLVASEEKNRHNDKEVEIEPKVKEEDFKPLYKTDSLQKDSVKEKPEENNQKNFPTWSWEDDDEQNCTMSCSSTAPSLITSGYGTYRPEEQEGGDHKDDHTITEFDQDSRGDLSEMRDNEEDVGSFSSYGGFDVEKDFRENQNENELDFPVACCERGGRREEVDTEDLKSNNNKDPTGEEKCEDLHTESENKEGRQRQPDTAIYEDT